MWSPVCDDGGLKFTSKSKNIVKKVIYYSIYEEIYNGLSNFVCFVESEDVAKAICKNTKYNYSKVEEELACEEFTYVSDDLESKEKNKSIKKYKKEIYKLKNQLKSERLDRGFVYDIYKALTCIMDLTQAHVEINRSETDNKLFYTLKYGDNSIKLNRDIFKILQKALLIGYSSDKDKYLWDLRSAGDTNDEDGD